MKKSERTKKTLIISLAAVTISVIMLLGSTFAWFTDTAESGKNQIIAGNLDVELYHSNSKVQGEKIDGNTDLFQVALWEPGVVAYENFEIKNVGNLALKYDFAMTVSNFNTIDGKSLKDALKVYVIEDEFFEGTRTDIASLSFENTLDDLVKSGALNTKGESNKFAVLIYWQPTENDNDFNLNNGRKSSDEEPLHIELGIKLVASQNSYESDAFGNDYDVTFVEVEDEEDFIETIKNLEEGQGIKLSNNVTLEEALPLSNTGETVIELNGYTLKSNSTSTLVVEKGDTLTIKNGNFELKGVGGESGKSKVTLNVEAESSLTLEDVKFTSNDGAGIFVRGDSAELNIVNSDIETYGYAISTNANSIENHNVQINIKNSTIKGDVNGAGTAMMVNVPCKLNIENSEIHGYFHGLIVRGGTVVIKDSLITNTTTESTYTSFADYFDNADNRNWGTGNMVTLGALVIGNKPNKDGTTSYNYPSNVTLINTKVQALTSDGSDKTLPTVYIIGNAGEGMGATLTVDSKSEVGEIVEGNTHVTVNRIQ